MIRLEIILNDLPDIVTWMYLALQSESPLSKSESILGTNNSIPIQI